MTRSTVVMPMLGSDLLCNNESDCCEPCDVTATRVSESVPVSLTANDFRSGC